VVSPDEVRRVALALPGAYQAFVRDREKFRTKRYVFLTFSRDETAIGFGFPKEERDALVAAEPDKFFLPDQADLRYHWVCAHLDALDEAEMRELVTDAWRMCVSNRAAAAYDAHRAEGT
jgi:hypothetical protein